MKSIIFLGSWIAASFAMGGPLVGLKWARSRKRKRGKRKKK